MNAPAWMTVSVVLGLALFAPTAAGQKDTDNTDKRARREQAHEFLLGQGRTAMLMLVQAPAWNLADAGAQGLLLHALLASGFTENDARISTQFAAWLTRDITHDVVAHSERVWIATLQRADAAELRPLVDRLCGMQAADGAFAEPARGKGPPPERVVVTGRVLEALAAAERLGVPAGAKVWNTALDFLLAAQGSDGGMPAGGRRPHGAATARGLAALLAAAARTVEPARADRALDAAARAEKWLVTTFRPDRNPGAQRGTYEWLGALEPAMARAWLVRCGDHAIGDEVFTFLQGAQLSSTGWNEQHLPELPLRTTQGGGNAAPRANPLVQRTEADITDTAWAVLFLARSTAPMGCDEAVSAAYRLAALGRAGQRAEDADSFVERARLATVAVLPALVDGLSGDAVLVRRTADGALRTRSGQDMGFAPQANRAANAAAIARWREWAGVK
jgi:hypothetical protein